jgi:uncharacterized protein (UPF0332 family)
MSLADELLQQARFLASLDPYTPKQANLRRAVSAAYYAVFHLFSAEVAAQVSPNGPVGLRERTQRALDHKAMYKAANAFSVPGARPSSLPADINLPNQISSQLLSIAKGFKRLQEERHLADYDVTQTFGRRRVLELVEIAENIFQDWNEEKSSQNAPVFLASLMFWNIWNK